MKLGKTQQEAALENKNLARIAEIHKTIKALEGELLGLENPVIRRIFEVAQLGSLSRPAVLESIIYRPGGMLATHHARLQCHRQMEVVYRLEVQPKDRPLSETKIGNEIW